MTLAQVKGIGQVLPERQKEKCDGRLSDIKGKELVIEGFVLKVGRKGSFALVDLIQVKTGERGIFITSSTTVIEQLQEIELLDAFPVRARMLQIDDYHILKNPKDLEDRVDE